MNNSINLSAVASTSDITELAQSGSLKQSDYTTLDESNSTILWDYASKNGNLELVKMLHTQTNPFYWSKNAPGHAIMEGHLNLLAYFREKNIPPLQKYV